MVQENTTRKMYSSISNILNKKTRRTLNFNKLGTFHVQRFNFMNC